jgi:hypothetical protein
MPNNSIWGEPRYSVITMGGAFYPANVNNNSTYNITQLRNILFYGYTPEFIVFDRIISPLERKKAESYLAIKYGLSLDKSYIGSNGNLLWDMDADKTCNNRITGYGRDDASGLYQPLATTSYEESPYFSGIYDAFYADNVYYESSPYRLLTFGKMKGSPMKDGEYLIMGDNGGSVTPVTVEGMGNMKVMPRKWLVNTHTPPVSDAEKTLSWTVNGLNFFTDHFIGSFSKSGADAASSGSAVTAVPLQGRDGYFSWTVGSTYGPLTIKFGTQNPAVTSNSNDYGYYINTAGTVFPIKGGVQSTTAIYTIAINQKVEIEKTDSILSLRINGYRIPYVDIKIASKDINSTFYGTLKIDKYLTYDIAMNNFRTGGFVNTGDRLELSYIAYRASDFLNYRSGGKSYLIIDRSGTGDFNPEDTEFYPASDLNELRSKIIFNNIFWNTRGAGKEVFTFGYKLSNVSGTVTPVHPGCSNDGVALNNGSVHVGLTSGFPGFTWTLKPSDVNAQTLTGAFYTDSLTINSLAAGSYTLTIKEIGGTNFSMLQADKSPTVALSNEYTGAGGAFWAEGSIGGNTTRATVGFLASSVLTSNPNTAQVTYGLRIEGNTLYAITKGVQETTPLTTVETGDRFRVEMNAYSITIKKNGMQLYSTTIPTADRLPYFYRLISLDEGSLPLYNLTASAVSTWNTTKNMLIQTSNSDQMSYSFTLKAPCNGSAAPPQQSPPPEFADEHISVYYPNPADMTSVTVSVTLDTPASGSVLVYNTSGTLVSHSSLSETLTQQDVQVKFPAAGIYVIKVITSEKEYTRKVVSK